jgi:1-acyl-sn-glycerol-3-phosphate acyltransferase
MNNVFLKDKAVISDFHHPEESLRFFLLNVIIIKTMQFLAWPFAYIVFKIFLRYKIVGIENIKKAMCLKRRRGGGAIFASNHISEFDDVLLTAGVAPRSFFSPMFHVSAPLKDLQKKKFKWRRFLYGKYFLRIWGAYQLRRGTGDYAKALWAHKEILEKGYNITLHPEGRLRLPGEEELPVKGGIGYLSRQTKSVIVPVAIMGIENMTYADFFCRRKKLVVKYLDPILAEEITVGESVKEYKLIAEQVVRKYNEVLKENKNNEK